MTHTEVRQSSPLIDGANGVDKYGILKDTVSIYALKGHIDVGGSGDVGCPTLQWPFVKIHGVFVVL